MDREILLRQLVQAEQNVAEGKAFIAKQQRLIVQSERDDCRDTAETMCLLGSVSVAPAISRGGPRNPRRAFSSKRPTGPLCPALGHKRT